MAENKRALSTVRDMVISLGVVLAIVGFVVLFIPRPNTDAVRVVDYATVLGQARSDIRTRFSPRKA